MIQRAPTLDTSVIIPAFNAQKTLGEQLAALARQRVPFAWEILVCDNGSKDGTSDVVRSWEQSLPNLMLVDASARPGPSAARNIGADHARGKALLFCDADDVVNDDWLSAMHAALQSADFVAGGRRYTLLNKATAGPADWTEPLFTKSFLPQLPAGSGSNLGVDAELFDRVGGFDESMRAAEDIDLCWRVQLAGYPLVAQPDAVIQMRRRTGLWEIFRQSYSYGAGDRILLHKYAVIIASRSSRQTFVRTAEPPDGGTSEPARIRRAAHNVVGRRFPSDLAFAVDRYARRLGLRFGRVDRSAPRVTLGPPSTSGALDA
ncbi:MAG TPA: glycosyltransferase [Galbitalea sp.]